MRKQKRLCSIAGCGRVHAARSYCATHYERWKLGTSLTAPIRKRRRDPVTGFPPCEAPGCDRRGSAARGLCWGHYARVLRGSKMKLEEPVRPHKKSGGQKSAGRRKKA